MVTAIIQYFINQYFILINCRIFIYCCCCCCSCCYYYYYYYYYYYFLFLLDYFNDLPVEELAKYIAASTNKTDKIKEWTQKLRDQDIITIGDLKELHEEDWAGLGLTVLATRLLKNALYKKLHGNMSPQQYSLPRINSPPNGLSYTDQTNL